MKSRTAGKQSVAVAYLTYVIGTCTCSNKSAGAAVFPQINVILGVEGNNTLAGSAGGGLDADAVALVCGKQSVGVGVPQVVLFKEGQLVKVVDAVDVVGSSKAGEGGFPRVRAARTPPRRFL